MGKNLIINEKQLEKIVDHLLVERLGVPDFIMDSAKELYRIVSNKLKTLKTNNSEFHFSEEVNLKIGDIQIDELELDIQIEELDWYDGSVEMSSMGVANAYKFDERVLMKVQEINNTLEMYISFIVPPVWKSKDLYEKFIMDETETTSILAHELKHKYDKTKKKQDLIGRDADYQAYSRSNINFGVPIINDFMRYSYFIQAAENLVRPTEIATRMEMKGITKSEFLEFLKNDNVYNELVKIKNFSYDYFIDQLNEQMDSINELLLHIGEDPNSYNDEEKIKILLELVYINLVNEKVENFDRMTNNVNDIFSSLMSKFGLNMSSEKNKIRNKFINYVTKYKDREMAFFVNECERFNYIATKMIKKISKLYDLAKDDVSLTNESIINWELHMQLMEKKYGRRKIETDYKFKKKK